mmetsp:Transcript_95303/g.272423  ORF Transcript_95303/g.272423 Transcript_95303/m.272423 type:complete len:80 (+) Transcript_95303:1-240(+)
MPAAPPAKPTAPAAEPPVDIDRLAQPTDAIDKLIEKEESKGFASSAFNEVPTEPAAKVSPKAEAIMEKIDLLKELEALK